MKQQRTKVKEFGLHFLIVLVQLFALYTIFIALVGSPVVLKEESRIPVVRNKNGDQTWKPSQIVLMVVDALRNDFITNENFPFLYPKLQHSNCVNYTVRVSSPTVTLPRIKALVTGTNPTYLDFITNLQSSALNQDNVILRLHEERPDTRICFFGDDTWLKMFPHEGDESVHYFRKWEGVSSFFVADYTEVDYNVSRNVYKELNSLQSGSHCQVMILHYLGLDHIGHVYGPFERPDLIRNKLQEMDSIVEDIYSKFLDENGLILLTGDHGMANIGGHGGNSFEETHTPLITLSKHSPSQKRSMMVTNGLIDQTDIAPTLATLLNITIPTRSVGLLLKDVLHLSLSLDQVVLAFKRNMDHLSFLLSKVDGEIPPFYNEVSNLNYSLSAKESDKRKLISNYESVSELLNEELKQHLSSEQDTVTIYLSIGILSLAFLLSLLDSCKELFKESTCIPQDSQTMQCNANEVLSHDSYSALLTSIAIAIGVPLIMVYFRQVPMCFLQLVIIIILLHRLWERKTSENTVHVCKNIFVFAFFVSPSLMYFSSSFIEEEHYIRYSFWTVGILSLASSLFLHSYQDSSISKTRIGVLICSLLFVHRLTCSLNQTGQKWTYLEDYNDYIAATNLKEPISFLVIVTILYLRYESSGMFFKLAAVSIGTVKLLLLESNFLSPSEAIRFPQMCYILVFLTAVTESLKRDRRHSVLSNCAILMSLLLHKLSNYLVILSVILQMTFLRSLFKIVNNKELPSSSNDTNENKQTATDPAISQRSQLYRRLQIVMPVWFAYSAFFYQGNSNGVTTIDVNAPYIGLQSYWPGIIGPLLFFHTYSMPVLIYTISSLESNYSERLSIVRAVGASNSVETLLYSVVILVVRNHLFIWSVFVPKLLYLFVWCVFHFIFVFLVLFPQIF